MDSSVFSVVFFFFQAEDGIRDVAVTGVQTCALPISTSCASRDRSRARTRSPRRQPYAWHLEGCWHALPDRQPARLCPLYRTRRYRASAGERSEERTYRPAADRTVSGRSG